MNPIATIGYATLSVIPSLAGAQSALEKQTKGPMGAAGKTAGKQFGSSFKSQFQANLKGIAGPLTAAFAGLSAKKILGDSVKAFTDLNLQVVQFRRLTGGSAEDASRLRSAVQLSGVDITKAGASLTIFSKNLGKAAGDEKKTAATTALLGTSFVDANGQVEGLTTLLPRVAEKFAQMEDGVAKTTLATTLFGRAGVAMIPFLNKGAAGIAELTAQSDKLGLTLTQADLDSFGDYRKASRELSASFQGLKVEAGRELLPALVTLTKFTTENAVPAIKELSNGARSAYGVYKELPGPVKDAAKAFILLRAASAIGLTSAVTTGAARAGSAMTSLRLQTMFAGDAFRAQRASAGLLSSSLAGIRVGARGAGLALAGLGRAILPVAVITAGITLFTQLGKAQADVAQKEEETKSRIEALTASLNQQTGALTDLTAETVRKTLLDNGTLAKADALGLSLDLVTAAALGNADAYAQLGREAENAISSGLDPANNATTVLDSLRLQSDELGTARTQQDLLRRAQIDSASTGETLAGTTKKYSSELDSARYALQKLINKEKERADKNSTLLGDRLGIEQAKADAANSLKFAKPGFNLDLTGADQKSRDRLNALRDLASTFNNADPKIQNAKGVYQGVRSEFERLAIKAGASKDEVKNLRDQLLLVPKTATTDFRTPGLKQAQADIDRLLASIDKLNANPRSLVPLYRADRADAVTPSSKSRPSSKRGGSTFDLGAGGLNANGRGPTVYQFNGPVTYTDEEEGRRRARNHDRRATGDGVRRR